MKNDIEYIIKIFNDRTEWQNEKEECHRLDGPAIEYANGDKEWHKNGLRHRIGGPAIERADGYKAWFQNGKLHRIDGPAEEYPSGTKFWYQNGKLHRLDGPAKERANGNKTWYQNGKRHRLDGPAVEKTDGYQYWYIDDKRFTKFEWQRQRNKPIYNNFKLKKQNMSKQIIDICAEVSNQLKKFDWFYDVAPSKQKNTIDVFVYKMNQEVFTSVPSKIDNVNVVLTYTNYLLCAETYAKQISLEDLKNVQLD